jgi:hypothetical protein
MSKKKKNIILSIKKKIDSFWWMCVETCSLENSDDEDSASQRTQEYIQETCHTVNKLNQNHRLNCAPALNVSKSRMESLHYVADTNSLSLSLKKLKN